MYFFDFMYNYMITLFERVFVFYYKLGVIALYGPSVCDKNILIIVPPLIVIPSVVRF